MNEFSKYISIFPYFTFAPLHPLKQILICLNIYQVQSPDTGRGTKFSVRRSSIGHISFRFNKTSTSYAQQKRRLLCHKA